MRLPATVLNALLYILTHVERGNVVDIGIAQLAEACRMTEPQASVALKRLRQERAIVAYTQSRLRMHMLNPAFGWQGTTTELQQGLLLWEARLAHQQAKQTKQMRLINTEATT